MEYLLSNGNITLDIESYITDTIRTNFSVDPSDIPFNTSNAVGMDKALMSDTQSLTKDEITIKIENLLSGIKSRLGLELLLLSITLIDSDVELNLSYKTEIGDSTLKVKIN